MFEHFTEQVAAQGWEPDAAVTSANVAMGSWTKQVDAMDLVGTLTVLSLGEDNWQLRFHLVRRDEGAQ